MKSEIVSILMESPRVATLITSGTGVVGVAMYAKSIESVDKITYLGLTTFEIGAIAGLLGIAGTIIVVGLQIRLHILNCKLIKKKLDNDD